MSPIEQHATQILHEAFGKFPLIKCPELVWNARLRVTAGQADFRRNRIILSPTVLQTEEQLRTTLLHEYAHLLAVEREGRSAANHGRAWQQAMVDLGEKPIVRHSYPVIRNSVSRTLTYQCEKCGLAIRRVRPLQKHLVYHHKGCGGKIKPAAHEL